MDHVTCYAYGDLWDLLAFPAERARNDGKGKGKGERGVRSLRRSRCPTPRWRCLLAAVATTGSTATVNVSSHHIHLLPFPLLHAIHRETD